MLQRRSDVVYCGYREALEAGDLWKCGKPGGQSSSSEAQPGTAGKEVDLREMVHGEREQRQTRLTARCDVLASVP